MRRLPVLICGVLLASCISMNVTADDFESLMRMTSLDPGVVTLEVVRQRVIDAANDLSEVTGGSENDDLLFFFGGEMTARLHERAFQVHAMATLRLLCLHADDAETLEYATGMLEVHQKHVHDSIAHDLGDLKDLQDMAESEDLERVIRDCSKALEQMRKALLEGT